MKHALTIAAVLLATACTDGGTVEPTWVARLDLAPQPGGLGGLSSAEVLPLADGGAYVVALSGNFGVFHVAADGTTLWALAPGQFTTVDAAMRGDDLLLLGLAGPGATLGGEALATTPGPVVLQLDPAGQVVATTSVGDETVFPRRVGATPGGGLALLTIEGGDGGDVVLSFRDAAGDTTFRQRLASTATTADLAVDPIGGDVFLTASFGGAFAASPDVVLAAGGGPATALARYGPDGTLRFARHSLGTGSFRARFLGNDVILEGFGSRSPFVLGFDGQPVSQPSLVTVDASGGVTVGEQLEGTLHPSLRLGALEEVGDQYQEGELRADPAYGPVALEVDRVLRPSRLVGSIISVRRLGGASGVVDLHRDGDLSVANAHPTADSVWLTMSVGIEGQPAPAPYGSGFVIVSFPL